MIPTSEALSKWLLHMYGQAKLSPKPGMRRLTEAVELNERSDEIISTFGKKEFEALVGFIDMRGFTGKAVGKCPTEVRDIVVPLVQSVIEVAQKHQCFIDKTIGDEVMVVMPFIGDDAALADVGLERVDYLLIELGELVVDLMDSVGRRAPGLRFVASFAMGQVILDQVGTHGFTEWTCYGNCVSASKRLQCTAPEAKDAGKPSAGHWFVVGAIEREEPSYQKELEAWRDVMPHIDRFQLDDAHLGHEEFKGVGAVSYLAGVPVKKTSS